MSITVRTLSCGGLIIAFALASGCSTTSTQNKVHQFSPVPMAKVGSEELGKPQAKNATELLRAANDEWVKGNEAQRLGDQKTALTHYSRMLQYMSDAELNPAVFSGLREEFERILSSNPESAELFERDHPEFNRELALRTPKSNLFQGNDALQQRVLSEIEDIKRRYPKNFQSGLDRSWQYRPFIEQQFIAAGLPKELCWLAMVESLFQPTVVSRVGATGMWQFMPSTGRRYGLRIDNYVDERRDWEKATRAAVQYLSDLHDFHNGAWPLAVASYNMGEGGISRMVAMNGGERDIWRLMETPPASDHMPEETKKFFPKLVAYTMVASSPAMYGFKSNPIQPEPSTRVPVNGSFSLAAIEKANDLPSGTLKRLNPALVRGATPPSGEYHVIVPAEAKDKVLASLVNLQKNPNRGAASLEGRTFHIVKKGDTLNSIAKRYGVDQKDIVSANKIRMSTRLPIGKKLLIPTDAPSDVIDDAKPAPAPDAVQENKDAAPQVVPPRKYKVKKGDTLYKIAMENNISLEALQQENKLEKHARIHVNQELMIPGSGAVLAVNKTSAKETATESTPDTPKETATHVVTKGESLGSIANKYGVKVDDLVKGNDLKSTTIRAGDKLVVARAISTSKTEKTEAVTGTSMPSIISDSSKQPAPAAEITGTYIVVAGDTLSGVAAKHKMKLKELRDANGLDADATIKVGQKLKVKGGESNGPAAASSEKTEVAVTTPAPAAAAPAQSEKAVGVTTHVVEKGQTLSVIAGKYNVKVSEIVAWNNLGDKALIRIGQKLIVSTPKVPAKAEAQAPKTEAGADGKKTAHKVTEGQSPASIAKRYGVKTSDLFTWNSWEKDHILHIGDEVIVYTKN
ncbi:MAG: LysM peptidoglycan-binding domain-containing protein [Candidatus Hydrogenedentes bacterium]|nr:LysM peptidoglycan-binding domain-containing protein [Candidatus Hydrogenedentota bacterium]